MRLTSAVCRGHQCRTTAAFRNAAEQAQRLDVPAMHIAIALLDLDMSWPVIIISREYEVIDE